MTDKLSDERYGSNIYLIRGQKVMLGMHLAEAYEIGLPELNQTIERNIGLFPEDSLFQLSHKEIADLKSQHAISGQAAFYAFTGQGVGMLSSILFDERAMHDDQEPCAPTCNCRN